MGLHVVEVFEGEVAATAPALVRERISLGVRMRVICPPAAAAQFDGTGASVTPLHVGTGIGALAALRKELSEETDAVHAHGLRAGLAVTLARRGPNAAAGRPAGTPLVLTWTEPVPTAGAAGLVGRALSRTVVPAAAAVVAATPDLAEAAVRLGCPEVRFVPPVLPPAPPQPSRTAEQVREELALPDRPIVLARAGLYERARLDVLIEASVRWRRAETAAHAVLVGVGPAYRDLVAQATVARAPVAFAGERTEAAEDTDDRATLADLLAASTLAVVTDVSAGPEFAVRAARAGVPLVVPQGGMVAQLMGGEHAGVAGSGEGVVTVPPGDADALDAAVRALLADPAARAGLATTLRRRVAGWPDPAGAAAQLVALYERVTGLTREPEATDTPGVLRQDPQSQ